LLRKGYYAIITMSLLILLALPSIVYGQPLGGENLHSSHSGSLVVTGSYDNLSIILPGENGSCDLEVNSASITNLTVYVVEGCNDSNIMIINSNIKYLVLFSAGGIVKSTTIRNSTITVTDVKWSTELVIIDSRLGVLRTSSTTIHVKNSVFGSITIDYAFELVINNSTGQYLKADLGVGYNYTNLRIDGLVMKCSDFGIPGYTEGGYSTGFGGPSSLISISSLGGNGYIRNTVFACPEGYSFMSVNGFEHGYISGLVLNSTNSSFAWIGFNPGILNIVDSEIYGNVTILLLSNKEVTLYLSNATITFLVNSTLSSRVTIEDTTLGHVERRGNATRLPVISEMITAENVGFDNVLVNAMILNLYSSNISINNSKINVRSLALYRPSYLTIDESVINSGYTTVFAYPIANYIINNSIINSNIILKSSNGLLNLIISNTAYQGDRVIATHLLNSTLVLNITNSRIDRASKVSVVGYPPWKSQVYFYTSHSYFGSLLGPRIVLNGSEIRPGGSTIEFTAVKAVYIINSWSGDPGLRLEFRRVSDQIYVSPLNGSIVPAIMKTEGGDTLVYLLELPRPLDKLYLHSNYEVNLSIMLNNAIIKTITGYGVLEVELPTATGEVIIIPNNIKPVKTVTTNTTTITNSITPPSTSTSISSRKGSTINAQILAAITLLITIPIAMYVLVRYRKS